jgi:hypothetical protein
MTKKVIVWVPKNFTWMMMMMIFFFFFFFFFFSLLLLLASAFPFPHKFTTNEARFKDLKNSSKKSLDAKI